MPSYPVLQPDKQLAVYSTVVDHFIAFDCNAEGATGVISVRHSGDVQGVCQKVAMGEKPYDHFRDWEELVGEILGRYGEEDETVKWALERTPDRRIPDLIAATWRAEGRMQEAEWEAETIQGKMQKAIDILIRYGQIDGEKHKEWVIDQALRALAGDDYEAIIQSACDGEDGPGTYTWEIGIAP